MAHMGQVDVRITATAPTEAEAEALIAPIAAQIRERLGEFIYFEGAETVGGVGNFVGGGGGEGGGGGGGRWRASRGMRVAGAGAGARGQLVARLAALPE